MHGEDRSQTSAGVATDEGSQRPVILVVDDESLIRWSLHERLKAAGYAVLEAESGPEALDVVSKEPVSLVLLDLSLPGLNGLAVLERVKKERPSCPVILMTAYDSPGSAERAAELGAAHFMTKPFDFDRVVRLVGEELSSK
jgi:DNA-binding NtrC family response regulator